MIADFSRIYTPPLRPAPEPRPEQGGFRSGRDRIEGFNDDLGGMASSTATAQELHFNNGTITIDIDGGGAVMGKIAGGCVLVIDPNVTEGFSVSGSGGTGASLTTGGFALTGASGTLGVALSDIGRNMGVRTIAVCDSGTPKSMDIIASDPY
jgi:hypothetical protein